MDKIPLLDMQAQLAPIREQIDEAVTRVMDSGRFILGEEVERLEDEICAYAGAKYAVGVSNGTDAITLSLEALGIKSSDKVICPSFTYYATAGAVARLGAVPVFVDIDPVTYCIDAGSVEDYFKRSGQEAVRSTKAIIPVHLYGQCVDMKGIFKIAEDYDLKVVEDAAQAFGASYKGNKAGIMGDCGTVSFFPSKNLGAAGDGGMVLTSDSEAAEKIRILRDQGADHTDKYRHIYPGHNNRLDAIQAAVLRVKLKCLDSWNAKRADNAAYYSRMLKDTGFITPHAAAGVVHIYHQYVLRAKEAAQKERIARHLGEKGIDARTYYPIPLHLQPCFGYLGYKEGDLPESEKASGETLAIPVYPELTKEQMDHIIDSIREAL